MADKQHQAILLCGAPGSGKGTQGKILGCIPGFIHISMGDVFRALDRGSKLGQVFHQYSSRGELVPDEVTISIWREHMQAAAADGRYRPGVDLVVLDGIPRNVNQAKLLGGDIEVLRVIHLTADEEEMVARLRGRALKQNRADDAREEVIRRRLQVYNEDTRPLLDHYPSGRIAAVAAIGTPAEVLLHILEQVAPVQRSRFGNVLESV